MQVDPDKWFRDKISDSFVQLHKVSAELYSGQTRYQAARVIRTGDFGKCLVLDGKIQSSELDEFVYHESLVQPAMIAHPRPESVFIAGGGEGATLREVLSHRSVKRAAMVDIDEAVIRICREYLPEWGRGAFDDSRAELHFQDARQFLADSPRRFDVIIIDLPDPLEGGPAYMLYTEEFYRLVRDRLTPDGIIEVQSGSTSLAQLQCLPAVNNTLKSVFPIVRACSVDMPCFGTPWGFCLASSTIDPVSLTPDEIDRRIQERGLRLKFYDGQTHRGMFALPHYVRESLARETRLIKDNKPLFVYGSHSESV